MLDQQKSRQAFRDHVAQLDKLIETVAALLIVTTTLLLYAICGSAIAAASGGVFMAVMIMLLKRFRLPVKRPRTPHTSDSTASRWKKTQRPRYK